MTVRGTWCVVWPARAAVRLRCSRETYHAPRTHASLLGEAHEGARLLPFHSENFTGALRLQRDDELLDRLSGRRDLHVHPHEIGVGAVIGAPEVGAPGIGALGRRGAGGFGS